jgi:SAM-dependent methyltransferase
MAVLAMDPMPLAGHFCTTLAEAGGAALYPLTWIECPKCSLIQVCEEVSAGALFDTYCYASQSVPGLVRHFEAYASWLESRWLESPWLESRRKPSEPRVLEIGCNDGVLLRRLPRHWKRVGVDPSDVARDAPNQNYELIPAPFTERLASELDANSFDIISGSNCLAHISDLRDVFRGVHRLLKPEGLFILEIHDLEATLSGQQWDTIYHEHKVEWSLRSLQNCLEPLGFTSVETHSLPLHGGLLRAVFRRSKPSAGPGPASPSGLAALRQAYEDRRSTPLYTRLIRSAERREVMAAYGASGRANVWLNQHPELPFEYVVDDAPLRSGRFIPRLAIPIEPSSVLAERPPDTCVITAWNYAADIRAQHPTYSGRWEQSLGGD